MICCISSSFFQESIASLVSSGSALIESIKKLALCVLKSLVSFYERQKISWRSCKEWVLYLENPDTRGKATSDISSLWQKSMKDAAAWAFKEKTARGCEFKDVAPKAMASITGSSCLLDYTLTSPEKVNLNIKTILIKCFFENLKNAITKKNKEYFVELNFGVEALFSKYLLKGNVTEIQRKEWETVYFSIFEKKDWGSDNEYEDANREINNFSQQIGNPFSGR